VAPESLGINDFKNDPKQVAELQQLGEAIRNFFLSPSLTTSKKIITKSVNYDIKKI